MKNEDVWRIEDFLVYCMKRGVHWPPDWLIPPRENWEMEVDGFIAHTRDISQHEESHG
jgi:hypothetical protein